MRFMRRTAGCSLLEHRRNAETLEELKIDPINEYVQHYLRNWKSHVQRITNNRVPTQILTYKYNTRGRRKLRIPMKRRREIVTDPKEKPMMIYISTALLYIMLVHYLVTLSIRFHSSTFHMNL